MKWFLSILSLLFGCTPHYRGLPIKFHGGTSQDRYVEIRDDTVKFHIERPFRHGSAQVPGGRIQAAHDHESYTYSQSVDLKIETNLRAYPGSFNFFTIWEYWAGSSETMYPFRIVIAVIKPDKNLYWLIAGQQWTDRWEPRWRYQSDFPVQIGEWMELEMHVNQLTGNVRFSVDGQYVVRDSLQTHHDKGRQPIHVHPMKLYTFKELIEWKPITIYWRGLKINRR